MQTNNKGSWNQPYQHVLLNTREQNRHIIHESHEGISILDYFTAQAMQGLLFIDGDIDRVSDNAIRLAKATLTKLGYTE